jgi:hypothetical protein
VSGVTDNGGVGGLGWLATAGEGGTSEARTARSSSSNISGPRGSSQTARWASRMTTGAARRSRFRCSTSAWAMGCRAAMAASARRNAPCKLGMGQKRVRPAESDAEDSLADGNSDAGKPSVDMSAGSDDPATLEATNDSGWLTGIVEASAIRYLRVEALGSI